MNFVTPTVLSTCLSIRTIQDFWHSTSTPYHHLQYSIHSVRVPSTHWILSLGALVFQPFRSLPQSTKGAMQSQVQLWVAASYCTVGTPCTVHTVCTYVHLWEHLTYIACRGIRSVSVHVCAVERMPHRHFTMLSCYNMPSSKTSSGTPICKMYTCQNEQR